MTGISNFYMHSPTQRDCRSYPTCLTLLSVVSDYTIYVAIPRYKVTVTDSKLSEAQLVDHECRVAALARTSPPLRVCRGQDVQHESDKIEHSYDNVARNILCKWQTSWILSRRAAAQRGADRSAHSSKHSCCAPPLATGTSGYLSLMKELKRFHIHYSTLSHRRRPHLGNCGLILFDIAHGTSSSSARAE
nr:hypothetical protein Iba_chr05eCG5430 [Ipomoea batatas]